MPNYKDDKQAVIIDGIAYVRQDEYTPSDAEEQITGLSKADGENNNSIGVLEEAKELSIEDAEVGDYVRYLGGDLANANILYVDEEYEVIMVEYSPNEPRNTLRIDVGLISGGGWVVADYNDHCFELLTPTPEGER